MSDQDEYDTTEKVERTDKGYRLTVESTRGTGTRDQDKVKAEARTESLNGLLEQRLSLTGTVIDTIRELRENQPDKESDE